MARVVTALALSGSQGCDDEETSAIYGNLMERPIALPSERTSRTEERAKGVDVIAHENDFNVILVNTDARPAESNNQLVAPWAVI